MGHVLRRKKLFAGIMEDDGKPEVTRIQGLFVEVLMEGLREYILQKLFIILTRITPNHQGVKICALW